MSSYIALQLRGLILRACRAHGLDSGRHCTAIVDAVRGWRQEWWDALGVRAAVLPHEIDKHRAEVIDLLIVACRGNEGITPEQFVALRQDPFGALDAQAAEAPGVAAHRVQSVCSICGGQRCSRESCGEEAGRLGLPRTRQVAPPGALEERLRRLATDAGEAHEQAYAAEQYQTATAFRTMERICRAELTRLHEMRRVASPQACPVMAAGYEYDLLGDP